MQEYQRKILLERIDRDGATVGSRIPEQIEIQGTEMDLREFVFEIKRRETIPPGERERVERAKKNLRRERLQRRQRIEAGEVSYEEGTRLTETIIGIDRALDALGQLQPADIGAEEAKQRTADRKRWMQFLKKALGKNDDGPRVG